MLGPTLSPCGGEIFLLSEKFGVTRKLMDFPENWR